MTISNEVYYLLQFAGVLLLGIVVIALEIRVVMRTDRGWDIKSTRIVGLTLVIVAALALVVVTDSDAKMSPIVAVLGSIAGYLFGRTTE